MAEYTYVRKKVGIGYDIENVNRVDAEGKQIKLAKEIQTAVPNKKFIVICNHLICKVVTATAWTSAQQTTLASVVAAHKANT